MAKRHAAQKFIAYAVAHSGDDCLQWPFARNSGGYGIVYWNGKSTIASKVVCDSVHGLGDGLETAHSCGNPVCVNPSHLRPATSSENKADKKIHGTAMCGERHPRAKLTEADVREIRTSGKRQSVLAREFGVTDKAISNILHRVSWAHV